MCFLRSIEDMRSSPVFRFIRLSAGRLRVRWRISKSTPPLTNIKFHTQHPATAESAAAQIEELYQKAFHVLNVRMLSTNRMDESFSSHNTVVRCKGISKVILSIESSSSQIPFCNSSIRMLKISAALESGFLPHSGSNGLKLFFLLGQKAQQRSRKQRKKRNSSYSKQVHVIVLQLHHILRRNGRHLPQPFISTFATEQIIFVRR